MMLLNCIAAAVLGVMMLGSAQAETRVITLGTQGGPMPTANRSQPANALVVNDRVYLIDAGNGVARQLVKAGIDHRRVGHIFITHNHDDHNSDWGTLMGYQWATGRRQPTHVYGPAGTEDMLKGFLQFFKPNARIRMADSKGMAPPEQMSMRQMAYTELPSLVIQTLPRLVVRNVWGMPCANSLQYPNPLIAE